MKFKAFLAQFLALNLLLPMSAVSIHAENNATNTNTTLNETQKDDICTIFEGWKNAGHLDYVCGWYKKAADLMTETDIRAALVSTNSVSQGDAVPTLWKPLFEDGIHIDYAYRTFIWDSEASDKAHVHCVIIGFSKGKSVQHLKLYSENEVKLVSHINPAAGIK